MTSTAEEPHEMTGNHAILLIQAILDSTYPGQLARSLDHAQELAAWRGIAPIPLSTDTIWEVRTGTIRDQTGEEALRLEIGPWLFTVRARAIETAGHR